MEHKDAHYGDIDPFLLDDEPIRLGVERLAAAWQESLSSAALLLHVLALSL